MDSISKLYEAAMIGSTETLDALIQEDKLILFKVSLSSFYETPLHISALLGHLDFTSVVLARCPKMAAELDSHKRSPLHLAAAEGHTEIVRALLGVNTYVCLVRDQEGRIPLHLAAMRGRVEAIEELMRANPLSVAVKLDGDTALQLCVKYNHFDALKQLMEKADFDDQLLKSKNPEPTGEITTVDSIQEILNEAVANPTNDLRIEVAQPGVKSDSRLKEMLNKFCSSPSNWVQETRGQLMVVATVLAAMSFQAISNRPGGAWQYDYNRTDSPYSCRLDVCTAGTPVLANAFPEAFEIFIFINTVACLSSLGVIFLIIAGAPFGNKFFTWIMILAMYIAVMGNGVNLATVLAVMLPPPMLSAMWAKILWALLVWLALISVVVVFQFILFCYWISRKCFRMLSSD